MGCIVIVKLLLSWSVWCLPSPGVLSVCRPPLRCWGPVHSCQRAPWPLLWLLLWVSRQMSPRGQVSDREQAAAGHLWARCVHVLQHGGPVRPGLLLPQRFEDFGPQQQTGKGGRGHHRVSQAVPDRGGQQPQEPRVDAAQRRRHTSHVHRRAAGLRVGLPAWRQPARAALPGPERGGDNHRLAGGWEGLPGHGLPPKVPGQRTLLHLLLDPGQQQAGES